MKLLIIGVDGAAWKVIDPLIEQGRMPHMARLIERGTRCMLTATEPVLSPIIWTSIASGKRPEKHGVSHFFHTASHVRCRRLWDILEEPDQPIGIFAWPITWPPRPANGFIIPSLFARGNETFPPDLQFIKEMEEGMGKNWGERLRLAITAMRHGLRPATVLRTAGYTVGQKLRAIAGRPANGHERFARPRFLKLAIHLDIYERLVQKFRPSFTSFYLNQTDAFSHRFWRYYEPDRFPPPRSDKEKQEQKRYANMLIRAYEAADRAIGRLTRLASPDTLIAVVSDHGFEAATAGTGEQKPSSPKANPQASSTLRFSGRVLGNNLLKTLDLARQTTYVNHRDWIIIRLSREAEARRAEILEQMNQFRVVELDAPLLGIREDETGEIVVKVWNRTYLYRDGIDVTTLHVQYGDQTIPFLDLVEPEYDTRFSGIHHPDGIAIFSGPGVRQTSTSGADKGPSLVQGSVLDVTPTLLALLGKPVGRDMDGRVLTEIMSPEFLTEHPPSYIDSYDSGLEFQEIEEDEDVPEELMSRLRALGYVD